MDELRALRWYEGDVTGNDPLWADSKAYVTLNAIFFDGIENEMIKAKENKHLNPAVKMAGSLWTGRGMCCSVRSDAVPSSFPAMPCAQG